MPYRMNTDKGTGIRIRNKILHNVLLTGRWDEVPQATTTEGLDRKTICSLDMSLLEQEQYIQRTDGRCLDDDASRIESGRVAVSSIGTIGSNCGRYVRARRDPGWPPPRQRLKKRSFIVYDDHVYIILMTIC